MHPAQTPRVGQALPDRRQSELLARFHRPVRRRLTHRRGFTLVEMLIAVAITLVMMAAVVTVFANISDSVQKRRATVEMSNSIRHVRNVLQQDLAGATCPTIPWQRPESNHGYLEIIEGPHSDFYPTTLVTDADRDGRPETDAGLNPTVSSVPGSNLALPSDWVTDGAALGDYDDILMLTVRNEKEPFVGRVPGAIYDQERPKSFQDWPDSTIRSPLAEVVWFAVENPAEQLNAGGYFGEPGFRTIYRRTLLVAPWLDPYRRLGKDDTYVDSYPGVVRILGGLARDQVAQAIAALISFQERYDLSVRLEWDPLLQFGQGNPGRWKIVANTLADLTKRENRYEHHGCLLKQNASNRQYPFAAASVGIDYNNGNPQVTLLVDPSRNPSGQFDVLQPSSPAQGEAVVINSSVRQLRLDQANLGIGYRVRPFAYVNDSNASRPATVRAIVNSDGQVVYLTAGFVPLGGARRGEDVMLTDALAFDVRVYDPGAPLLGPINQTNSDVVVEPGDAGWSTYLQLPNDVAVYGYGAYVDLGYLGLHSRWRYPSTNTVLNMPPLSVTPQFAVAPRTRSKLNLLGQTQPYYEPYRVYDTWSFHYENNGINEDGDTYFDPVTNTNLPLIDEGTNGFDDAGDYILDPSANPPTFVTDIRHGVDDPGERETAPPYDVPLRGMQVRLRAYERDSRQVREVGVKQHFVPE